MAITKFLKSGKFFTFRGDVLKLITDYIFILTVSADAKFIIDKMDDIHFDIHAGVKA